MQLGTRWDVGATPPARLDAEVLAAIAEVEAGLAPDARAGLRWTLTWLEGRPVAELDDGTTVTIVRYGWDGLEVVSEA
jgi:hypothetical protein